MQTEEKSTRPVLLSKAFTCDFQFSCNLQGHFACTLQHSVADRIGLLRSATDFSANTLGVLDSHICSKI